MKKVWLKSLIQWSSCCTSLELEKEKKDKII